MHKTLMMLSDRLCRDIEDSMHEEKLTPATLEMLDKSVDIIKDIETIKAMDEYGDYSERGRYSYGNYRNSYGHDEANLIRRMDGMNERDRQRLEDFIRQM